MKLCSRCNKYHDPPLGQRCSFSKNMAGVEGSGFADGTSKEYLEFLEEKFLEFTKKQQDEDSVLNRVLQRLDKIEAKQAGTPDPKLTPNPADLVNLTDSIHKFLLSVHHQDQQKSGIEY